MPEAVCVGLSHTAAGAMMTKQAAQAGRSHGLSTSAALQRYEHLRGIGERTLAAQVAFENADSFRWQRQHAHPRSLAAHPQLALVELQIPQLQAEHLARTQPVQQH
jgi:hypothetical protein